MRGMMIHPPQASGRIASFDAFVRDVAHPCVMARSVLQRRVARFGEYDRLGDASNAPALCADLYEALREPRDADATWSFVAFFDGPELLDERSFEQALWAQLQTVHEHDAQVHEWDPSVSSDPADAGFSFSVGGRGWYVIGLHPAASRLARRFESVVLVFNPHRQFEQLRAEGRYDRLKSSIRDRDVALQGSVNPALADHGTASEARQYSGRDVPPDWRCPFRATAGALSRH
jgi:uncharacterized protein